jgi:hypothetical protein
MVEEEDLELIKVKLEKLKLEREDRISIPKKLRMRERLFCCSCEEDTGVAGEFECFSCKHIRCPACWVKSG